MSKSKSFNQRSKKAKTIVEFGLTKVAGTNGQGVRKVYTPGSEAKRYWQLIHRSGGTMYVECFLDIPNGEQKCPGNQRGLCYHAMAAVYTAAKAAKKNLILCQTHKAARRLCNLHNGRIIHIRSRDSNGECWGVFYDL